MAEARVTKFCVYVEYM